MSFSFQHEGAKDEVATKVKAENAPRSVKAFIEEALANVATERVFVKAYGHLHDGTEGNYKVSTANIEVRPPL